MKTSPIYDDFILDGRKPIERAKVLINYNDLAKKFIINSLNEIVIIQGTQLTTLFEADYDKFRLSYLFIHHFFRFKMLTVLTSKQFAYMSCLYGILIVKFFKCEAYMSWITGDLPQRVLIWKAKSKRTQYVLTGQVATYFIPDD
jgi:hypothetical protein